MVAYAPMAAMMPSMAASPLMRSAFSFMVLRRLGFGSYLRKEGNKEASEEAAKVGVGHRTPKKKLPVMAYERKPATMPSIAQRPLAFSARSA